MHTSSSLAAIILAAGSSSRMGAGRHKLLLPLAGRPVLAHVLEAVLASSARPVILVLGHQADAVRAQVASYLAHPAITIVENPDYLQGMSTSMRAGLEVLMTQARDAEMQVGGAIILLGDQPLVTPEIIDALISRQQETGKRIVAPLYEGRRGNPTLFAASLFPELMAVMGDEGGRSVLARHREEVATVEVGDTMVNYDVDTWEAYQQVVAVWQQGQQAQLEE